MGFGLLSLLGLCCGSVFLFIDSSSFSYFQNWLILDDAGLFLSVISILFFISFCVSVKGDIGKFEASCLVLSLLFSIVCFISGNSIMFWVSYELSIIPLLVSLYVNSPYSERYLAGWYLLTYVILTSLPMLLAIVYLAGVSGSFSLLEVSKGGAINYFLFVLFITKVPLPPFHAWLPIVHAEASTYVSVCLSGYIMKLGIIGVYRFCFSVVSELGFLVILMFGVSLLFFFSSCSELDTKRWLAFLSLSHILVSLVGLYFLKGGELFISLLYCLGHGLSAGLLFYLFMILYRVGGTRNWLLASLGDSGSLFWRVLLILGLLTVSSFPPSISFMSEVWIIVSSLDSLNIIIFFCFYLFLGGLVPMVLLSNFICNVNTFGVGGSYYLNSSVVVVSIYLIWFLGGLLM